MDEALTERVAWRRKSLDRQYLGRLFVLPDRLRLVGREPSLGIEMALSIPFSKVRLVRAARRRAERVLGETGVVLDLADSEPIFLRDLDPGGDPDSLCRALAAAVSASSRGSCQRSTMKEDAAMKVEDVMTKTVHTVTPEASLKEVAALLAVLRISGLPVVAVTGAVFIVASMDAIHY